MKKLVKGLQRFRSETFAANKELFERLSTNQSPEVLFITCSDSRIYPNLITSAEPGELFILRNAGNIVPPYGTASGGEAATIEYAVEALGVKDVIICGHTNCGAMKGLLFGKDLHESMPSVKTWLQYAETTKRLVLDKYPNETDPGTLINIAVQENVLLQLVHLQTHPAIASAISRSKISLHGWVFKIDAGDIFAFDADFGQFRPLTEHAKCASTGRLYLSEGSTL